nr:hypothetical protein [Tanacetum cinerariifolium]
DYDLKVGKGAKAVKMQVKNGQNIGLKEQK